MVEPTDEQAARANKVAEAIVEVLAVETDTILASAGLAMALSWLAMTRMDGEADALQLVVATGDTARDEIVSVYEMASLAPELIN